MKKSTLIPLVLLAYLAVMSYIGYGEYAAGRMTPLYYFGVIGSTLLIIILLHFFIKKRERLRRERLEDMRRGSDQSESNIECK